MVDGDHSLFISISPKVHNLMLCTSRNVMKGRVTFNTCIKVSFWNPGLLIAPGLQYACLFWWLTQRVLHCMELDPCLYLLENLWTPWYAGTLFHTFFFLTLQQDTLAQCLGYSRYSVKDCWIRKKEVSVNYKVFTGHPIIIPLLALPNRTLSPSVREAEVNH